MATIPAEPVTTRPAAETPPAPPCIECGQPIIRRRRTAQQNAQLCLTCDQRARRSAYFQRYYASHKEGILAKNRRWARDNKDKLVLLRQARQARQPKPSDQPRVCMDCGTIVVRAQRCRRCYIRFRYATDQGYRSRRLATTRRWLERRQAQQRQRRDAPGIPAALTN